VASFLEGLFGASVTSIGKERRGARRNKYDVLANLPCTGISLVNIEKTAQRI
jgi:hypothetical protein